MLREISNPRQIPGEARRRWFTDAEMDLTVWLDDESAIAGFQLCYGKGRKEQALTWRRASGFAHHAVDDGEARPGRYKATPILIADGSVSLEALAARFEAASVDIDQVVARFVLARLRTS